jgi:UDP-glucuronate decarboxylase
VVRQLLASGDEVAVVVRPGSRRWRLEDVVDRLTVIEADLDDGATVRRDLERLRPEACIHAAWYAEPGRYLPSPKNLDSLRASLGLLEVLAEAGCKHVVGVGTCFEYQIRAEPLEEDSPTGPFTLYAAAKLAFSLVAAQRAAQLGVGFAWARLFYLYGPYEDERRLVPAAIKALSANQDFPCASGEFVRDYLHVEDVAAALCAISRLRLGGVFNVSSYRPVTIAELMRTLGELLGRPQLIRLGALPKREWDPAYVCGDNRKLSGEAHWAPKYALRAGLEQTIQWWKNAG